MKVFQNWNDALVDLEAKIVSMKKEVPDEIGHVAQRHFTENFNKQGFDGEKWEEVKRRTPGTPEYKYPKKGAERRHSRGILIQTGDLRRAVAQSLRSANWDAIRFEVSNEYGAFHNEGTDKLPRREFMGNSEELNTKVIEILNKKFLNCFK